MSTNRIGTAIPIFPCRSIDEQLDFYQALGFEVTYRQAKPNLYARVRHRIVELHFLYSNNWNLQLLQHVLHKRSCCGAVHRQFCENLKKTYQKILSKGFPRVTKLNNLVEDRRFNPIDPAGNRLLIGQKYASSKSIQNNPTIVEHPSRFTNAFETAYRLAYAKGDPAAAAKVLDLVLSKAEEASAILRYKAFVLRADIAAQWTKLTLRKLLLKKRIKYCYLLRGKAILPRRFCWTRYK